MKLSRIQFSFEVGCSTSTASGGWRETVLKNRIPIINLSIEEIIGDIPAAYVELAVDAARRALPISSLSNSNSSKPLNTVFFNRQDQKSSTLEPKRLISRKR